MHTLNLRSFLWFATGVALTVTSIGTLGAWRVDAGGAPVGESTFVPVAPCRLFDTRPGENIPGSNTTPIGVAETRTQQVTGNVGNCSIPSGISGVAMNVTILNPTGTADSFLTLFPANETTLPVVSNLNWSPGQGATPNKVDVKVSPDGKIKIYNNLGTVDVIGDIVGYYTSSTVTQLSTDVANLQVAVAQLTAANATQDAAIQQNADDILDTDMDVTSLLEDTNVIPSGVTVTGSIVFDHASIADDADIRVLGTLPGRSVVPLTGSVNFAPSPTPGLVFDGDPTCTGTPGDPTAPAGKVCIYIWASGRVDNFFGVDSPPDRHRFFAVSAQTNSGAQGEDVFFYLTWAYTEP